MSWLRIDDGFVEHPKVMELSDRAFRLHMAGLCFCARNLTDGILTVRASKTVCALTGASRKHLVELRDASLWIAQEDGWQIKDFLDFNPDGATVKELREARKVAGRRGGLKSGETRRTKAEANEAKIEASASSETKQRLRSKRPSPGVEPRPVPSLRSNPLAPDEPARKEPAATEPDKPPQRERDLVWETLLEVCGIDQGSLTRTGRGAANRALAEIREAGGTDPLEVRGRAAEFRKKWPQISLTPSALAKHWGSLRSAEVVKADKYSHLMEVPAA